MPPPCSLLRQTLQTAVNSRQSCLPPTFLIPSLFTTTQSSSFSTSSPDLARRDRNKSRGVSALRATGPRKRQTLSAKLENLPKPVPDDQRSTIEVDPDHGLWGFFNRERTPFAIPEYDNAHGRAWTVNELRNKDWEDLHRLWWVCLKERNRLSTEDFERRRVDAGYGEYESQERLRQVKVTQRAIKHVLTERWYAWEDARKIAARDPEVNLAPEEGESAYNPREYEQDQYTEEQLLSQPQDDVPGQIAQQAQTSQSQTSPEQSKTQ